MVFNYQVNISTIIISKKKIKILTFSARFFFSKNIKITKFYSLRKNKKYMQETKPQQVGCIRTYMSKTNKKNISRHSINLLSVEFCKFALTRNFS